METLTEMQETAFDVIESIRKHVDLLKPITLKRGLISVGDYPAKILLKAPVDSRTTGMTTTFFEKSNEETLKALKSVVTSQDILAITSAVDTHFWFNVNEYIAKNEAYALQLKTLTETIREAIVFASLWEGLGSALLPNLVSQFKASNASAVALAILPSKAQPSDAYFNTLASIGLCAANDYAAVVLLGRDFAEDYVGVDRAGLMMKGNSVLNYLLDIMISKDTLMQELNELSRAMNVKLYSAFCVTGASYKVFGNFRSLLDAASLNMFLPFDLSTASVLYLLVRAPLSLKDKLSRGKIEMATAKWSKRISNVKSIYVSEPIYMDDTSDRVDIIVLAGNFDLSELAGSLQKKAAKVKNDVVRKGLIKEEDWAAVVANLATEQ